VNKPILPTEVEFLLAFDLFPKGNPKEAFTAARYAIIFKKTMLGQNITWIMLRDKWTEYIAKKRKEGTDDQYIRSMKNFIEKEDYNIDFSKQPSQKQKETFDDKICDSMSDLEKRLEGGTDE